MNEWSIALVAHDGKKSELLTWAEKNKDLLVQHKISATGTTGKLLKEKLGVYIQTFLSGPLGGDQQIGAAIAERKIDILIFLWDPLEAQPHDPDVKALLRLATVWDIPIAMNISTAEALLKSEILSKAPQHKSPNFSTYLNRFDTKK